MSGPGRRPDPVRGLGDLLRSPDAGLPSLRDGPRARWLRAAEERFGPKVWGILQGWRADRVDRFIAARFIPFEDSRWAMEEEDALKKGRTTCRFEKRAAEERERDLTVPDPTAPRRRRLGGGAPEG